MSVKNNTISQVHRYIRRKIVHLFYELVTTDNTGRTRRITCFQGGKIIILCHYWGDKRKMTAWTVHQLTETKHLGTLQSDWFRSLLYHCVEKFLRKPEGQWNTFYQSLVTPLFCTLIRKLDEWLSQTIRQWATSNQQRSGIFRIAEPTSIENEQWDIGSP